MSKAAIGSLGVLLAVALLAAGGCATSVGPRTIPGARFDYNQAIADSWNEQLLLNLVRLRYRDTLQFLEVSSVINQYDLEGSVSASAGAAVGNSTVRDYGLRAGVAYSDHPTITYTPLQGEEFAQRVLAPIPAETLILLAQSGWSTELLMLCCVQQLNDLRNARATTGRTPDFVPRFEEFHRAARLLRELQAAGLIDMRIEVDPDRGDATVLSLQRLPPGEWRDQVAEVRRLLGLDPEQDRFRITSLWSSDPNELAIVGRSLVGVLFFLSQAVQAPPEHVVAGKVTVTTDALGKTVDWALVTGDVLRIRSDPSRPEDPYVAVFYRDHWFSIADDDLESKTTFGLLTYLFSLQAAGSGGRSPLLTVSTGR